MRKPVQTTCTRLAVLSASLLRQRTRGNGGSGDGTRYERRFRDRRPERLDNVRNRRRQRRRRVAGPSRPSDVTGSGASNAAEFDVGHTSSSPGTDPEGGGLYQTVTSGSRLVHPSSADIASNNPAFGQKSESCGLFELMLDGNVVASHDFGACPGDATQRFSLASPDVGLPAGAHEVRVLITRPYGEDPGSPHEYVDNVALTLVSSLPTPSLPTAKQQCTNGGWKAFSGFKNQGDCVSYVAPRGAGSRPQTDACRFRRFPPG